MFEAKRGPSGTSERDLDLTALVDLGLIEPGVDEDGRAGYRLSAELSSPDFQPNDAFIARLTARRHEKRRDTP